MKLPEYSLKREAQAPGGPLDDPIVFPPGTLCMPFWSEHNLPKHIKDLFKEHIKYLAKKNQYVMCLIGKTWIPVLREDIRKN